MSRRNKPRAVGAEANLAERIRRERVKRDWSPADLADQLTAAGCSISTSAIYRIEAGDPPRRIAVDELIALGQVFGASVDDLLTPVEVLDQRLAQQLLKDLDAADELLIEAVGKVLQGHTDLLELAAHEPDLYNYVYGHRFRSSPAEPEEAGTPKQLTQVQSIAITPTDAHGESLDVSDLVLREGFNIFYQRLIEQASQVAAAAIARTKQRDQDTTP